MAFGSFVLTDFGLSLEAKMKAGKQVTITRIALGDGSIGTGSIFSVTKLKSERFSLPVNSISHSSDEATVTAILTNEMLDEGFNLREMGLMAIDPDTKVEGVYSYNRDSGEGEYLPDKSSSQRLKEYLRIRLKSSSVENIIFESSGSPVDLTQEDLNNHNSSETAHLGLFVLTSDKGAVGGVATLDDTGKVPSEQIPTMDYDEAGSAATVQKALDAHKKDKKNPHALTASQVGAVPTDRKVNGKPLDADITLKASDVSADSEGSAALVAKTLEYHTTDTTSHITEKERDKWNGKQDKLAFDTTPKSGSTNPVTSGGVAESLSKKAEVGHDHDERYFTKEQSLGALVASGGGSDVGELEDTAIETGCFKNAGAGWNTFTFREAFEAPPQVMLQAEDFSGVVLIKSITAKSFLYCLRTLSDTTTATAVSVNYIAIEYGGDR